MLSSSGEADIAFRARKPRKLVRVSGIVIFVWGLMIIVASALGILGYEQALRVAVALIGIPIGLLLISEGLSLFTMLVPPTPDELEKEYSEELQKIIEEVKKVACGERDEV